MSKHQFVSSSMDNDDWDLFSIVRSCNTTTFTTPTTNFENPPPPQIETTTNNITFSQIATPFCFDDFTFNQENSPASFAPLKPNDFIDLDKLMNNSNPLPTLATASTPKINTTTTSSPTTTINTIPSPLTTTTPTHITNINTSVHVIHTPTITTPPTITPIITATSTTTITSTTTTPVMSAAITTMTNTSVHETNQYPTNYNIPILAGQQQIQQNINNQASVPKPVACIDITTAHFDRAYNHPSVALCGSRKRKHNNQMALVCYMRKDELSKDLWAWRKYGQKPIKGSPHPRSYYKCSTWADCPARRKVEKCKTQENTYIVTYEGDHNHAKPTFNKNIVIGTSQHKSPETVLHSTDEAGSSTNITNSGSTNVVILQIDHPKSSDAQVLVDQSKISYPEMELLESQLPVVEEVGLSSYVRNLGSHNKMIKKIDEPQSSNVTDVVGDSNLPYSETGFIGSFDDNDEILIPNITAWSEDYLMDFNRLNGGSIFP